MIPDTDRPAPDAMVGFRMARQEIQTALQTLPERDREILTLHFGLAGNEPLTLTEIAKQKGLSRERIRQIKERSLVRLKAGMFGQKLHYLLDG
jgi:RNA polymerase primary sigma factor